MNALDEKILDAQKKADRIAKQPWPTTEDGVYQRRSDQAKADATAAWLVREKYHGTPSDYPIDRSAHPASSNIDFYQRRNA